MRLIVDFASVGRRPYNDNLSLGRTARKKKPLIDTSSVKVEEKKLDQYAYNKEKVQMMTTEGLPLCYTTNEN